MAKVHGSAGENALSKSGEKQGTLLATIVVIGLMVIFAVGTLFGLSFSRKSFLVWIALAGMLVLGGIFIWLKRKIDLWVDKELREVRYWRRGAEGEKVVAEILETQLSDEYHVFHDVRFPGRKSNIDHIVVGPSGVFILNTKNWRGTVGWDTEGKTLLWNGEPDRWNSAKGAMADALDVHDKLRALLNRDVFVRAILVFPLAKVQPKLDTPVELQQDDYLVSKRLKYIDKRHALSEKEVVEIVNALLALFRKSV